MRAEIVIISLFFAAIIARPFTIGPHFKEILDDNVDLKGQNRTKILEDLEKELGLVDVKHLEIEYHLVLLPPNLVVNLCLKNDEMWQQLMKYKSKCPTRKDARDPDVACMLGKMAVTEQNAGLDHALLASAILQCRDWWRLAGETGKTMDHEDAAMGRCLLQALSTACHPKMDRILTKALHK